MSAHDAVAASSLALAKKLGAVAALAFFLGFALVPLYEIACEKVFGVKLGTQAAAPDTTMRVDASRLVTVQFDAAVHSGLSWQFKPKILSMQVHPGQLAEVMYEVSNISGSAVVGNAVPSVAPNTASLYFNKTECFCFTEQLLAADETRDMAVRFLIDPKLPSEVRTITLGYTFYLNDTATRRLAHSHGAASPAS